MKSSSVIKSQAVRISEIPVKHSNVVDFTEQLKTPTGTMQLRDVQNEALTTASRAGGLVALIGCGYGKTLITLLLAEVLKKKRPLLLLPASLRDKTHQDIKEYSKHFEFDYPEIVSYETLSRHTARTTLQSIRPDLIICDEAHHLKDMNTTRVRRLGGYIIENPKCRLAVLSGTLYNRSLSEIAHLSDWALDDGTPLPRDHRGVQDFDAVISGDANKYQYKAFHPLRIKGMSPRESLYQRLKSTEGYVLTTGEGVKSSLQIKTRSLRMPLLLRKAINECFAQGPMAEVLTDMGDVNFDVTKVSASQHLWEDVDAFASRALAQMSTGLLYFWDWPNAEPDHEWMEVRRAWNKAVRHILDCRLEAHDSRFLIESEFESLPEDLKIEHRKEYNEWQALKDRPKPPTEAIWVSDYIIADIKLWTKAQKSPYIIWVDMVELGRKLQEELDIPYYGAGTLPSPEAENCIMSIKSHGTGKNLQAWSNNFVVHPMSCPAIWEQLIARTHRAGQQADTVCVTAYNHSVFGSALFKATQQAKIVSDTTGQPQRLVYADRVKA